MTVQERDHSKALARKRHPWGTGATMLDRIFDDGSSFNFYQAVKILSHLQPDSTRPPAHGSVPVHFRSRMGWDFPGSDIHRIAPPKADETHPQMVVNFIGLAGAHGPLPVAYTEQLLRDKKSALRDFLDMFHHRLILLVYRIHEMHHPELTCEAPDKGLAANHLYACFGLGRDPASAARDRLAVPDRALLNYSGLLAHRPHTASGLQALLSDYFQVAVTVEQFTGAWLSLDEDQWTILGSGHSQNANQGRNQSLGDGAILGKRVWDEHAGVTIRLRSLNLRTFESFLPGGAAYDALQSLTAFYLGEEIDFTFKLELRVEEIPWAGLSGIGPTTADNRRPQLGRLAWLKSPNGGDQPQAAPDAVVIGGDL
ncbi:MAG TPA: type VI secretion system baseplate subunit TssG [Granulicella sp.]|nr:type VI secretion system baseplate subunit TssG [Granulicella sp.]